MSHSVTHRALDIANHANIVAAEPASAARRPKVGGGAPMPDDRRRVHNAGGGAAAQGSNCNHRTAYCGNTDSQLSSSSMSI